MTGQKTRVLVVDDSAFTRRSIADLLRARPEIEVIGKAADGEEALRLVSVLEPDAITLDLEMPRMDGFTFLRILMSKRPTPVVVVSSYSQKENVFRALELGAIDFVAKPTRIADLELSMLRDELADKVLVARQLGSKAMATAARDRIDPRFDAPTDPRARSPAPQPAVEGPPTIWVAIASSTGGPTALMEVFRRLPSRFQGAVLVAQHMPDKFTRTFAERLDRRSALAVSEAADLDIPRAGRAFVCPGRRSMELELDPAGGEPRLRIRPRDPSDRYVPSADRLLESVARVAGERAVGVVLTGMGDDGARGAMAIREAGGVVVAEAEHSAVVYGMPGAAVRSGAASRSLDLREISEYLTLLGS